MRYTTLIGILLLSIPYYASAQDYTFEELLRIPNGDEVLIGNPRFIVPEQNGDIYIADSMQRLIYRFDKNGNLVKSFGRRGRGPGEFSEISAFFKDNSDHSLIAIDRMNMRLNRFDEAGELIETVSFPREEMFSPWMGRTNEEGDIFLLYRNFSIPGNPPPDPDFIIHQYDKEFKINTESFVDAERFGDLENEFMNSIIGGPTTGFFDISPDNEVLVTPFIFDNQIYIYRLSEDNAWLLDKTLKTDTVIGRVFEQINANTAPDYARTIGSSRYGRISSLINSESVGIFALDDKYAVLFTYLRDDDYNGEFGYSLFDYAEGEFLIYEPIAELNESNPQKRQISPISRISYGNGKFYFVDSRGEEPEIVVAEITFNLP